MEFGSFPQRFSEHGERWLPGVAPVEQPVSESLLDVESRADSDVSISASRRANMDPLTRMRFIQEDWRMVHDQIGDDAILAGLESQAKALRAAYPDIVQEEWDTGQFKKIQ